MLFPFSLQVFSFHKTRDSPSSALPPARIRLPKTQHCPTGGIMTYQPDEIIARIEWCRLQQHLPSVTPEEREGWRGCLGQERTNGLHAKGIPVSFYALSMWSGGWESPPARTHFTSQWHDTSEGAGTSLRNDPGSDGQTSLTSPFARACGVSPINCLRRGGHSTPVRAKTILRLPV